MKKGVQVLSARESTETITFLCNDIAGQLSRYHAGYCQKRTYQSYVERISTQSARLEIQRITLVRCFVEKKCGGILRKWYRYMYKRMTKNGKRTLAGVINDTLKPWRFQDIIVEDIELYRRKRMDVMIEMFR